MKLIFQSSARLRSSFFLVLSFSHSIHWFCISYEKSVQICRAVNFWSICMNILTESYILLKKNQQKLKYFYYENERYVFLFLYFIFGVSLATGHHWSPIRYTLDKEAYVFVFPSINFLKLIMILFFIYINVFLRVMVYKISHSYMFESGNS